jgi:hypothetical protein
MAGRIDIDLVLNAFPHNLSLVRTLPLRLTRMQRLLPFPVARSGHGIFYTAVIRMPAPRSTRRRVSDEFLTLTAPRIMAATRRSTAWDCE